jgi:hypothetical protein
MIQSFEAKEWEGKELRQDLLKSLKVRNEATETSQALKGIQEELELTEASLMELKSEWKVAHDKWVLLWDKCQSLRSRVKRLTTELDDKSRLHQLTKGAALHYFNQLSRVYAVRNLA